MSDKFSVRDVDTGSYFQKPANAGYSWLHPVSGQPHFDPWVGNKEESEKIVAIYRGRGEVVPA